MAANPGPQGGPAHGGDKEWFTIDKTNGTGHGFQYQFWTGFFACDCGEFTRSTDGGLTWMSPINVPNDTDTGALDVDTNGNLFSADQISAASSDAFARPMRRSETSDTNV